MKKEYKHAPQSTVQERIRLFIADLTVRAVLRHLKGLLNIRNLFVRCPSDKHYKRCVVYNNTVMCDNCGATRRFEIDTDELDSK